MTAMMRKAGCVVVQGPVGQRQVLLVSSRYTGEWIVPKGGIERGESPAEAAVREAAEEAGVVGRLGPALGTFRVRSSVVPVSIDAFVLEVTEQHATWPEQSQRRRRWFTMTEAISQLRRPEMRAMLERLCELEH